MAVIRYPAVAGAFYPADPRRVAAMLAELVVPDPEPVAALGVMVPHAGWVFSGRCAGETLGRVDVPPSVILLGPNHTGMGAPLAAAPEDAWMTPVGRAEVDHALLGEIASRCPDLVPDAAAHRREHCLEVEVPLLLARRPDVRIAPIVVGTHDPDALARLGKGIAEAVAPRSPRPLILVSSDMTHYEPAEVARSRDMPVLERLAACDPAGALAEVARRRVTMCGIAPAVAALEALGRLGCTGGELVCYTHSGEVTGDDREVVAYAGMIFR